MIKLWLSRNKVGHLTRLSVPDLQRYRDINSIPSAGTEIKYIDYYSTSNHEIVDNKIGLWGLGSF